MAHNNDIGLGPVGAPHAYEKQEVGKPSRNAAQPCAVCEDPYGGGELRDGWTFRVCTWNVESLTGRSGELEEALGERRIDIACVQEIRWRGGSCGYFGAAGERCGLFWMGGGAKAEGVGMFVAERWVDGVVTVSYTHLTLPTKRIV